MAFQTVFKRYELKYMLTSAQKQKVLLAMKPYMQLDKFGRTTIRNIYYDTDSYLLVRRSIDKPMYKEKLRIRSYQQANAQSTVFVELKKKYDSVVYKRRISLPEQYATDWVNGQISCPSGNQIGSEIDYFLHHYPFLTPAVFLSYEREAFYALDNSDLRITFDDHILCRQDDLSLRSPAYGTSILPDDTVLMEVKCSGGIPLWLTRLLSKEKIYKTSYSKYGIAYQKLIYPHLKPGHRTKEKV